LIQGAGGEFTPIGTRVPPPTEINVVQILMDSVRDLPEADQVQVFDALRLVRTRRQQARIAEMHAKIVTRMPSPEPESDETFSGSSGSCVGEIA